METMKPEMLSAKNLQALLGVSRRWVWRKVKAGELPQPRRLGGFTRWRRAEIEAFMDALPVAPRYPRVADPKPK